jgi:hypothetical protein
MSRNQLILLRPREAAKGLAISERKLWSLTKENEIKASEIRRFVRNELLP